LAISGYPENAFAEDVIDEGLANRLTPTFGKLDSMREGRLYMTGTNAVLKCFLER
jgi:hypothetical protein